MEIKQLNGNVKCVAFLGSDEVENLDDKNVQRCEKAAVAKVVRPSGTEYFLCQDHLDRANKLP